jgi:hypothetical protein
MGNWFVLLDKCYSGEQLKKNTIGGTCGTFEGEESACKVLERKPAVKRPLGKI